MAPGIRSLLAAGAATRVGLLLLAAWQDARLDVKFTDIDYTVFSDAAGFVLAGGSPYDRSTYRYTPLIAYLLLPNAWTAGVWGKVLFCSADIFAAWVVHELLLAQGVGPRQRAIAVACWLFNPYTAAVSARGNCEATVAALLAACLLTLYRGHVATAAVLYGLLVHWRVYPIIYALPLILFVSAQGARKEDDANCLTGALRGLPTRRCFSFAAQSAFVFLALGAAFYAMYGSAFLHEAFLYHLSRRDPRHSFSLHFLDTYLGMSQQAGGGAEGAGGQHAAAGTSTVANAAAAVAGASTAAAAGASTVVAAAGAAAGACTISAAAAAAAAAASSAFGGMLLSALPSLLQLGVCGAMGLTLYRDLPFCLMMQTMAFVAFNKVCTAQYFVWYLSLLPLVLPELAAAPNKRRLALAAGCWVLTQLHWLGWGYLLEFRGLNVYLPLWGAGAAFFAANVWLMAELLAGHRPPRSFLALSRNRVTHDHQRGGRMCGTEEGEAEKAGGLAAAVKGSGGSGSGGGLRRRLTAADGGGGDDDRGGVQAG